MPRARCSALRRGKARIPLAFSLAVRPIRGTIEGAMTAAREACRTGDSRTGVSRTPGHRPASSSPAWPGPGLSDSTPPRILIIDDEPQISGVVGRVLEKAGYVADSGAGPVALTRLEFLCLRALIEHGGDSVTKSELLACVWGIEFNPGSNIVDVCIRRLRAKLGFTLIETVRGEGYRLAS